MGSIELGLQQRDLRIEDIHADGDASREALGHDASGLGRAPDGVTGGVDGGSTRLELAHALLHFDRKHAVEFGKSRLQRAS